MLSTVLPLRRFALASILAAVPIAVAASEGPSSAFRGEGKVLAIDVAKSTVTLDHGVIPGLMPPMRMRFTVDDRKQLRRLQVGDVVQFSLGSRGDEMVIVTIEPLEASGPAGR